MRCGADKSLPDAHRRKRNGLLWILPGAPSVMSSRTLQNQEVSGSRSLALVGMGAGQPSRVAAVELAVRQAGPRAKGAVLASDAFFPMPDGVETAAQAGVRAIVQPGGSQGDREVIAAADAASMTMVFTGKRHFLH